MSSAKSFRKEEIADKTVIDSSGKVIGKVKDLTFTLDSSITLIVQKADSTEMQVPLSKVMGVSDHVIIKEEPGAQKQVVVAGAGGATMLVCKSCGTHAKPGTMWCPGCGRSLA
jgi:sporulation protein YlmC with PRC-barrel domain